MDSGWRDFLLRHSTAELQVLTKVLGDLAAARKVGVRLVPDQNGPEPITAAEWFRRPGTRR
jgi:hypothetical protein